MAVDYWRSSRNVPQTDYLGPSCYLVHRASTPDANPMTRYPAGIEFMVGLVMMPFIETFAGQWLPIQLTRRQPTSSWWIAGLVSVTVFTVLHGYTDRFAVTILRSKDRFDQTVFRPLVPASRLHNAPGYSGKPSTGNGSVACPFATPSPVFAAIQV